MNNPEVIDSVASLIKLPVYETIKFVISVPGTLLDYWELTLTVIGLILGLTAGIFITRKLR
jgi:hypothetical protein